MPTAKQIGHGSFAWGATGPDPFWRQLKIERDAFWLRLKIERLEADRHWNIHNPELEAAIGRVKQALADLLRAAQ